jgi:Bacterial dipeptidyl-peptidase Sh3 domain
VTTEEQDTPAPTIDPRRNAFRPDLAASYLEGKVQAERYTSGAFGQIIHPSVPLRRAPDVMRGLETEALFGEAVTVFDEAEGWAWVQLARDGYVGYIPASSIRAGPLLVPNHRVQVLGTFVYGAPDIKTPPVMHLPLNALLTVTGGDDRFVDLEQGARRIFGVAARASASTAPALCKRHCWPPTSSHRVTATCSGLNSVPTCR